MANAITILTEKRRKLGERKTQLRRDYEQQVKELDDEIKHISSHKGFDDSRLVFWFSN